MDDSINKHVDGDVYDKANSVTQKHISDDESVEVDKWVVTFIFVYFKDQCEMLPKFYQIYDITLLHIHVDESTPRLIAWATPRPHSFYLFVFKFLNNCIE